MVRMMYLRAVNLASLDLNLLVALDALLAEASVGRAAMRIGLSQPAASHALRRLREILHDPLLVRVGARMELTPRARELRAPLAQALDQLRGLFITEHFDPATCRRRFALRISDHLVSLLLPPLMERISAAAPGVRLDVVPWRGPAIMTAELARSVDLVITCVDEDFSGFHRERLFTDTDEVAVRRGHPVGARLQQLEVFLAARHVAVVGSLSEDPIDTWLREQGVERHIALVVPSYLQALHLAARTDLVAFVPQRLVRGLMRPLSLISVGPPIDPGTFAESMFYPTRLRTDPASLWLRSLLIEIGRDLDRHPRRAA